MAKGINLKVEISSQNRSLIDVSLESFCLPHNKQKIGNISVIGKLYKQTQKREYYAVRLIEIWTRAQ